MNRSTATLQQVFSSSLIVTPQTVFFNATATSSSSPAIVIPGPGHCLRWSQPQHVLFHLANACFFVSYVVPSGKFGVLFMHILLILAFLLFCTWAWNVICAPNVLSWNFFFMVINIGQTLYTLYTMREVKFPAELEDIYQSMFHPLKVSRLLFKKLVSQEYSQIMSLHAGEAYAMQNLTKTDRLGLLITGKVNVISHQNFLHFIHPKEFLDSPEFESYRAGAEDKFKVSIIAASPCRYIFWTRQSLEYLLVKETYLSNVLSLLLSRDITTKLYAMNEKTYADLGVTLRWLLDLYALQLASLMRPGIGRNPDLALLVRCERQTDPTDQIVTEKGSHLDIRLPSLTGSIVSQATTTINQDVDVDEDEEEAGDDSTFYTPLRTPNNTRRDVQISLSNDIYKYCDTEDSIFESRDKISGPSTSAGATGFA